MRKAEPGISRSISNSGHHSGFSGFGNFHSLFLTGGSNTQIKMTTKWIYDGLDFNTVLNGPGHWMTQKEVQAINEKHAKHFGPTRHWGPRVKVHNKYYTPRTTPGGAPQDTSSLEQHFDDDRHFMSYWDKRGKAPVTAQLKLPDGVEEEYYF